MTGHAGPADHLAEQHAHRLRQLHELHHQGVLDQPYRYPTDHSLQQVRDKHPDLSPGTRTTDRVRVAGRLALLRHHGSLTFATLRDQTGTIQLFVDTDTVRAAVHRGFDELDRGDWVGVEGTVMTTLWGELSVAVESVALLGNALVEPVRAENPVTVSEQQVPGGRPRHHRPDESQHDRLLWPSDSST